MDSVLKMSLSIEYQNKSDPPLDCSMLIWFLLHFSLSCNPHWITWGNHILWISHRILQLHGLHLAHSEIPWRSDSNNNFTFLFGIWFSISNLHVSYNCKIVQIFQVYQPDLAWNSSYDSLTIYDGGSKSSDQIGKFCGNSLPPNKIISSSHQLLLHFKTDWSGIYTGFQIDHNTLCKFYKSIPLMQR